MTKIAKVAKTVETAATVETVANTEKAEVVFVKLALPKGSKVTKQNIITPILSNDANTMWHKERWFAQKTLKGFSKGTDGIVTIEIDESKLVYRA